MSIRVRFVTTALVAGACITAISTAVAPRVSPGLSASADEPAITAPIDVTPPDVRTDRSVRLDYDIVYVRAPRYGDDRPTRWPEIAHPAGIEPGADLMLLHPDGSEEVLVGAGSRSVTDPYVSFDGRSVFYSLIEQSRSPRLRGPARLRADIYKIDVRTRRIVRLTQQTDDLNVPGVLNLGPCPVPGGRIAFVSNRNDFHSPKSRSSSLQLFVMDEDGSNVELIGAFNLGSALHPSILANGRLLFSTRESQGLRNGIMWGIWSLNPDGTNWAPAFSAFDAGHAFHFQTELSDGSVVIEEYYNQNNNGFGAYLRVPASRADEPYRFGPADKNNPRNPRLRFGRFMSGQPKIARFAFSPPGVESLTPFASNVEGAADLSRLDDPTSIRVGKVTHPSGAPDNHLLTVWSPGPVNQQGGLKLPAVDGGIYLIRAGSDVEEPADMLLIKNSPEFNEQFPRALVPYSRIYGVASPRLIRPLANDGRASSALGNGVPYALIGAASLYKRETYPGGAVPPGRVTAAWPDRTDPNGYQGLDPFNTSENVPVTPTVPPPSTNWIVQGADAGRYTNDDIHAIRILALEPARQTLGRPRFYNHADERMRILGEIPVRKFETGTEPRDPDGNPDTSFLAKIPADLPFTFQTLDRNGMVLNFSQTWHQLRPGEIRTDCGGCHAHSQPPTPFASTRAGAKGFVPIDLTQRTPLLADRTGDESGRRWDLDNTTGLRYSPGQVTAEYEADIKPILRRSCTPCHSERSGQAAAGLVLDDDTSLDGFPGTFYRLAMDQRARFGYKPIISNRTWRGTNASRYIRKFQSRRSLLVWKIFGRRLDGWTNDDFPTESDPGNASTLRWRGAPLAPTRANLNRADLDYTGSIMPPPAAVAGTYIGPDGQRVKVAPLTDEDRRTLVRWIDLGCPLDLDAGGNAGWNGDDQPPTLTMTVPARGSNVAMRRIVIGMHDHQTGLDASTLNVTADFPINGTPAGQNLASQFRATASGVWELRVDTPPPDRRSSRLVVSVSDRRGNQARIDRTFSVSASSR